MGYDFGDCLGCGDACCHTDPYHYCWTCIEHTFDLYGRRESEIKDNGASNEKPCRRCATESNDRWKITLCETCHKEQVFTRYEPGDCVYCVHGTSDVFAEKFVENDNNYQDDDNAWKADTSSLTCSNCLRQKCYFDRGEHHFLINMRHFSHEDKCQSCGQKGTDYRLPLCHGHANRLTKQ